MAESGLVSHCYLRSRHPPEWPYNLFAMVHGKDRNEVETKLRQIAMILGSAVRAHEVLYSSRILKKTGLRLPARHTNDARTETQKSNKKTEVNNRGSQCSG